MFCPKCGSILRVKKDSGKKVMACTCGYINRDAEKTKISETVKEKQEIGIVDQNVETLPLMDADCPKCAHKKAYYWLIQTRAGDEPETKFLRCEKCKHTWRDYS